VASNSLNQIGDSLKNETFVCKTCLHVVGHDMRSSGKGRLLLKHSAQTHWSKNTSPGHWILSETCNLLFGIRLSTSMFDVISGLWNCVGTVLDGTSAHHVGSHLPAIPMNPSHGYLVTNHLSLHELMHRLCNHCT
jgi:hypothetical protein